MPRAAGRDSCYTCRRRKVRCDQTLPVCTNCKRRGVYCDRSETLIVKQYQPDASDQFGNSQSPREALQKQQIAELFHIYIKELAPWYDLNDEQCAFAKEGARKALDSPLLFAAIIAFAGIYMYRKVALPREIAETYHARCLRLLIGLSANDMALTDGTALASTCLLRSYEILSEDTDPNRHLFGASALVPSLPDLSDHSLLAGGFWNYLREDITYSLIHECPLKLQPDATPLGGRHDDELANDMTLLLGRTVNAYFGSGATPDIFSALQVWRTRFRQEPFAQIESVPFEKVKMLKDCHVAALQYYNVALCMLADRRKRSAHAEVVCALAMSAESNPVVVNSYGPICFVGQWLTPGAQRGELIAFLERTQAKTGWSLSLIISRLKSKWERSDIQTN